MIYLNLSFTGLLIVTFYGLISCGDDNTRISKQLTPHENKEQLNETLQELVKNVTNPRSGRTLLLSHTNRKPAFTLRRRQPIQIRSRKDHFPIRTQIRRVQNGLPNGQPQHQNMRHGYDSLKSSKYSASSKGAALPFPNNGKGSPYRPQLLAGHPNSIHVPALSQQYIHNFKASPSFNGQVVVHPAGQTQKQQQQQQPTPTQQDNSYPKYVKPPQQQPATAAVSPQQKQKSPLTKYPEFKQYPIPDQEKMQQTNEQHEKYLQQQKFLTPKNPIAYYQMPHNHQQQHQELSAQPQQNYAVQQPVQYLPQPQQHQPSIPIHESTQTNKINNVAFPATASVAPKMYSVYEENDMTELQTNYQSATHQGQDKEAHEYLRFMNTDEYFLPKKEPNYKRIDDETDKRQNNVLKAQVQQHLHSLQQSQAPTPYQQSQPPQTSYHQQIYTPSAGSQGSQYSNSIYPGPSEAAVFNQGLPVSRLFYQHDPSALSPSSSSASGSASSTVVRTSYQTGFNQNQFVVNSQDNRIGKYTIPATATTSSIVISTQSPAAYPQLRYNAPSSRTPEPVRFEFTERDAMIGGFPYTNAPQGQLRYKELTSNGITPIVSKIESSTASSLKTHNHQNNKHAIKPVSEDAEDDPEDGDDMDEAGNDLFGRQPIPSNDSKTNTVSSTTEEPPSEQKDTEEYCERICAIVEDENEEIVCGSDGYMYTSEAQMECYASCLHIDITIQGKGSCSKR